MVNDRTRPVTAIREAVNKLLDVMGGRADYSQLYDFGPSLNAFGMTAIVQEVVAALEDLSVQKRVAAAGSLFYYRAAGVALAEEQIAEAEQVLIQELKSRDTDAKLIAAKTAGSIGVATDAMIPALKRLLRSKSPEMRVSAAAALAQSEVSPLLVLEELQDALGSDEVFFVSMAARGFGRLKMRQNNAVQRLFAKLPDVEPIAQITIVNSLAQIGGAAVIRVPGLIALMKEPKTDLMVRAAIAQNLGIIAPEMPIVEEALISALQDRSWEVVQGAIFGLNRRTQPLPAKAIRILVRLLTEHDGNLRRTATSAIAEMKEPAPEAVPALVETLLTDSDGEICRLARNAVVKAGVIAVPVLLEWMKRNQDRHGPLIHYMLSEIGPVVIPEIMALFRTTDDGPLRAAAAVALRCQGPNAVAAVPELMELARTGEDDVPYHVVVALSAIGPKGIAAVDLFVAALVFGDDNAAFWATEGLKSMGEAAVPTLQEAFDDADGTMKPRLESVLSELKAAGGRGARDPLVWLRDDAAVELFTIVGTIIDTRGPTSYRKIAAELKGSHNEGGHRFLKGTSEGYIRVTLSELDEKLSQHYGRAIRLIESEATRKGRLTTDGHAFLQEARRSLKIRIGDATQITG